MHPIVTLRDGTEVYVNLINAEISRTIARQPHLVELVKEILQEKVLSGSEVHIEQDMGRVVGNDFVVTTKEGDSIFYAKVLHDETYTRFIKNGSPNPTQYVTITLRRVVGDRTYELYSARIGRLIPSRPDAASGSSESRRYWESHAVMHTGESLQSSTISKSCPY